MIIEKDFTQHLATVHHTIAYENLGHISTLQKEFELLKEKPQILLDALQRNVVLVERAIFPTHDERQVIDSVSKELKDGQYKSASNLLDMISGYEPTITELASSVIDPGTQVYRSGIYDLEQRLAAGITIMVNGDSPHDNEPDPTKRHIYDFAIWGHTRGATSPLVNIEFWAAHQVERVVTAGLANTELSWTRDHKDWLLNIATWRAVSDIITGHGLPEPIREMWERPRPNGLGWASEKRIEAYRTANKRA